MSVLALTAPDLYPLASFCKQATGEASEAKKLQDATVEAYLASADDALMERVDPSTEEGERLFAKACDVCVQPLVAAWVADQNERKGLAPTADDILRYRQDMYVELTSCHAPRSSSSRRCTAAEYKWLARLKKT